jgi:hypothetical protein
MHKIDGNNSYCINLCISSLEELYEPYSGLFDKTNVSGNNMGQINSNLIDYLIKQITGRPKKEGCKITIKTSNPLIKELDVINDIKNTIDYRIISLDKKIRNSILGTIVLIPLGVLFCFGSHIFPEMISKYSLQELLVITSWVFICRAVELFFFDSLKYSFEKIKYKKLYIAEYNYE